MSADRETNHDMTHRDIALLLADAADEAEIGIAPYQAVVRGGRRRKARRWALAAAAALVIAGSTGTLALAGGLDGEGRRVAPVATRPPTAEERHVFAAQRTTLAVGYEDGKTWEVFIDVWGAAQDEVEAEAQLDAMGGYRERPADVRQASDLIGKTTYFLRRSVSGLGTEIMMFNTAKEEGLSGTDLQSFAGPLLGTAAHGPERLVAGQVGKAAQRVTCTWKDGTTTDVRRVPEGYGVNSDEMVIRPVAGSRANWFVCLAPKGTTFKSVAVTK
ncbi:hypothetical protein [Streptomyces sp. NPDC096311]|uniref:hypothetical protein n=1 Tax=Streptomyces sp. NPDC096311 TaxID=3366083 RepID=UPI00382497F4